MFSINLRVFLPILLLPLIIKAQVPIPGNCAAVSGAWSCTVTTNATQLQQTVDLIGDATRSGQKIVLSTGTWNFPTSLTIRAAGLTLEGIGPYGTQLVFPATVRDGILIQASEVSLRNFLVNSNTNLFNNGNGVAVYTAGCRIDNVFVRNFLYGIYASASAWSTRITNCNISGCGTAIFLENDFEVNDITISENKIFGNYQYGIWVHGGPIQQAFALRILNNAIENCGLSGILIESATGVIIANNYFEANEWRTTIQGNDAIANDTHILLSELGGQIRSVTIRDNFFGNFYPMSQDAIGAFVLDTEKHTTGANTLTGWRKLNGSGMNIIQSGNYYRDRNRTGSDTYFYPEGIPDGTTSLNPTTRPVHVDVGGVRIYTGTGTPTISAPNGSIFLRTDGTGAMYTRRSGTWYSNQ